jgi:hypothetical protein
MLSVYKPYMVGTKAFGIRLTVVKNLTKWS